MPKRGRALHHRDVHPGSGLETIESLRRRLHPGAGPSPSTRPPAPVKPSGSLGAGVPAPSTVAAFPEPARRPGSPKPPHSFRTWYVSRSLFIALGIGTSLYDTWSMQATLPQGRLMGFGIGTSLYDTWSRLQDDILSGYNDICHTPNTCLRPRPCACVLASPTTAAFVPTSAASDPTTSAILSNGCYESHGVRLCEVAWMGPAFRNV